jgi:methionine sulfoxide reductase heme-binding subunit
MIKNFSIASGWNLVAISTLVLAILIGSIAIVHGIDESSLRLMIRSTARTSVLLFIATFVATAVRKIYPGKISNWLLTNRRYLGLSFAISHFTHALAIICLAIVSSNSIRTDHGGILGYIFIGLMMLTSFDRPADGSRKFYAVM